jgi:hypothetical protein
MLEPTGDYLKKRADQLGLGRGEALAKIQKRLDELFAGQVRATSLNKGVLRLVTASAPVASELRIRQVELLRQFRGLDPSQAINNLQISIG